MSGLPLKHKCFGQISNRYGTYIKKHYEISKVVVNDFGIAGSETNHLCKTEGLWEICLEDVHTELRRGPETLGPARRVAEKPFIIVYGKIRLYFLCVFEYF